MQVELCLEHQCQAGNRKQTRKEKVRPARFTATHLNVSDVSTLSRTLSRSTGTPLRFAVNNGENNQTLKMWLRLNK